MTDHSVRGIAGPGTGLHPGDGSRHAVSVVIPAKGLGTAKSRLGLPDPDRRRIALRLVTTTVRAALDASSVGTVLVVTSDVEIAAETGRLGAVTVPEPPPFGLNAAARLGRRRALALCPNSPVAILVADLPLLEPADLDTAVAQFRVGGDPLSVADRQRTGTTMLIHGPQDAPEIQFGKGSAAAHLRAGFRSAEGDLAGLRTDLDVLGDLPGSFGSFGPHDGAVDASRRTGSITS
jgi:2-phospho-L-lactate guanylyltransferase